MRSSAGDGSIAEQRPRRPATPSSLAIAGAVHDLGNLIQVASSAINIALRDARRCGSRGESVLAQAKRSLEQATALSQTAIGIFRGRALGDEITDVSRVISDVASLLTRDPNAEWALDLQLEPDLPPVCCSSLGMQSALLNLVLNARDAMAGRGRVLVAAKLLREGPHADAIELSVTDDGPGMTAEILAGALKPFFTSKADGTGGIGLFMVERFALEAEGSVSIESELGVGTRVSLRLPAILHS